MSNGTILADHLELLVDVVKARHAHVLLLVFNFFYKLEIVTISLNIC